MKALYRSPLNRDVPPARQGEFRPVAIGPFSVWPPVVLAPMAGVTNPPFRTLCRHYGAGLYVSEMITARALVEGNRKTLLLASFDPAETTRSLQLYGTDPHYVGEAVRFLVGEGRIDHLDMNFGCPVRKVTSKGGGAAIPLKPRLLRNIVRAAVQAAGLVPVTIKFRIGIDERYHTHLEAGRIAQEEGCAAVALHARTAAQLYDGEARWDEIARLKQAVTRIPVLGNGDIWEAEDALRMMRATGCDGVVVGRGCLGRPWLFRDLADVFRRPRAGVTCPTMAACSTPCCPRPAAGLVDGRRASAMRVPQALVLVHEGLSPTACLAARAADAREDARGDGGGAARRRPLRRRSCRKVDAGPGRGKTRSGHPEVWSRCSSRVTLDDLDSDRSPGAEAEAAGLRAGRLEAPL